MTSKEKIEPQPFVKWAGGKRWLAAHIEKIKPKGWSGRYYEPFVGGGALFFALQPKRATLSDTNEELIKTYLAIRNNPDDVPPLLTTHSNRTFTHSEGLVTLLTTQSGPDKKTGGESFNSQSA